jgi:uncharacterized membrane protein YdjX (TVP38/TMEM64 family)
MHSTTAMTRGVALDASLGPVASSRARRHHRHPTIARASARRDVDVDAPASAPLALGPAFAAATLAAGACALSPDAACAAAESTASLASSLVATTASSEDSGALVDRLRGALETLETLPRLETVPLWLAILTASEMVPLLPTQPLALTSGILFGTWEGAAVVLSANVAAATLSFLLAGGVGRALAEKIIEEETGTGAAEEGAEEGAEGFAAKWSRLQDELAASDPARQAAVIALYRLTPHPFSASNYLFGLTKLRLTPYVIGTAVGLVPWAGLYAASGAYGRKLLDSGEAFDQVLADVSAVVRGDVEIAEEGALAVAAALAVVWGVRRLSRRDEAAETNDP